MPLPGLLGDGVAEVVDDIGVVAVAALHLVGAAPAVEAIGGGVAVERLARPLPVASIAAPPVKVRFSTFAESANVAEDRTVSSPLPASSVDVSPI